MCPPPFDSGGEGHTRWRERGWRSPNSDEGTYTVVLYIFVYFVLSVIWNYKEARSLMSSLLKTASPSYRNCLSEHISVNNGATWIFFRYLLFLYKMGWTKPKNHLTLYCPFNRGKRFNNFYPHFACKKDTDVKNGWKCPI